jgi:ribosomal protein S19E (S16A)
MNRERDTKRRKSILTTLAVDGACTMLALRRELESAHFIAASGDVIRADLDWLTELGLIQWNGELAQCTERGRDVAAQRAKFPGEA